MKKLNFSLLFIVILFFINFSATAQLKTWVGPTGGSWGVTANWSPTGVPSTQDVLIPSGSEVNVDVGAAMGNLTVETEAIINKLTNNAMTTGDAIYATNTTLNFIEGNIVNNGGTHTFNGEVNIIGSENKLFWGGQFIFNDTLNIENNVDDFNLRGSTLIIPPSATMTVGDGSIDIAAFSGTLRNEGLIQKTSGSGTFTIDTTFENIGGTINIDSGSMVLDSSATLTDGEYNVNSNGFMQLNGGAHFFNGTLTGQLDGPFVINSSLRVVNGGVNFLDFSGPAGVEWRAGALSAQGGPGTILVNLGLFTVTSLGSQVTQLAGAIIFRNESDMFFNAEADNFSTNQGSIFNNTETGVITIVDGVDIGGGPFNNTGLIEKITGTGSAEISNLNNSASGVLSIETGNITITSQYTGNGLITGAGSITTSFNTEIASTIAPGNDGVGTLQYNNVLDFEATADCIYQLEINGTTPGTEHDVFAINTKARLDGTLDIILGYNAQIDDEFVIMTFPNIMECNLPAQVTSTYNGVTYTYDVNCNVTNVTLKVNMLGVKENALLNLAIAYPNPSYGEFRVNLGKDYSEINTTITNVIGQVIASGKFENTDTLNLTIDAAAGIYFVNVTTPEGLSKTIKIIKN